MKAYRGVDGRLRTFRPGMNMARMNISATRSGLPTFEGKELLKCLYRLISIDEEWVPNKIGTSLYIRPTLIGTDVSVRDYSTEIILKHRFFRYLAHAWSCHFRVCSALCRSMSSWSLFQCRQREYSCFSIS